MTAPTTNAQTAVCSICRAVFTGQWARTTLSTHMKNKHGVRPTEMKSEFTCQQCGRAFPPGPRAKTSLANHLRITHKLTPNNEPFVRAQKEKPKRNFNMEPASCPDCKQVYTGPNAAAKVGLHRSIVHGIKGTSTHRLPKPILASDLPPLSNHLPTEEGMSHLETHLRAAVKDIDERAVYLQAEVDRLAQLQLELARITEQRQMLEETLDKFGFGPKAEVAPEAPAVEPVVEAAAPPAPDAEVQIPAADTNEALDVNASPV